MKAILKTVLCCTSVLTLAASPAVLADLRVGAARIDVTPAADQLPALYRGVNDRVYARAIVVDNDGTRAALITLDAGGIPTPLWQAISERLASELSIAPEHLLLTATHTHSVPRQQAPDYIDKVVESVSTAISKLQPARMAWGTGQSWINVNRNMINPATGRWGEGPNYEGPSDKTVAVLAFETLDGAPLAVYYNYAVHGVIAGQLDEVSGDIPGATSRYIEESLGDDAVAVWSLGAAGDQNPIFFEQTYDLRKIRIADYARRGEDISNSMPPGGTGLDRNDPDVTRLMNQQRQMLLTMGQMLGEEVLRVMKRQLEAPRTDAAISGAQKSLACPGRRRTDQGREGSPGTYEVGEDVNFLLSMLRIGDVYLGGVNAEVFNPIALRFKDESPYKHSMMVTLTNGTANSGYVPHDAAFGYNTFEVLSSRLQPGCAEKGIVEGLLGLMEVASDDLR
jgi:neutral ceramidase